VDLWTIRLRRTGVLAVDNDKAVIHRAPLCPQAPQAAINFHMFSRKRTYKGRGEGEIDRETVIEFGNTQ
jgi:hypothetical protein